MTGKAYYVMDGGGEEVQACKIVLYTLKFCILSWKTTKQ